MSDPKRELDRLRQEMARLDAELLSALEKRAAAARRMGDLQRDQPPGVAPTAALERERTRAVVSQGSGVLPEDALREIFREIHATCSALEHPVRIALVGPEGGVGHAAARRRFGAGAQLEIVESAATALDDLARKRVEVAVVPYETSSEGPVQATMVSLVAHDLKVIEVLEASFDLHLMSATGDVNAITRVYATAADRASCERGLVAFCGGSASRPPSLGAREPGAPEPTRGVEVLDTASPLAACRSALSEPNAAALVTESVGLGQGLAVARRGLREAKGERARWAVVSARPAPRSGADVTAVAFSVHDGPGALLDVLKLLAERGINLTKIQSRPVAGEGWNYLFFVELSGHATERTVVSAFEDVKRATRFFKVLGSYPADEVAR